MHRPELVKEIRDYMRELYKAEYVGHPLEVTELDSIYTFIIGIPSYMQPTTIACEAASDEEFMVFIKEELRIKNYMRLYFYKVVREKDGRTK